MHVLISMIQYFIQDINGQKSVGLYEQHSETVENVIMSKLDNVQYHNAIGILENGVSQQDVARHSANLDRQPPPYGYDRMTTQNSNARLR